jgi:hypothetical protein
VHNDGRARISTNVAQRRSKHAANGGSAPRVA